MLYSLLWAVSLCHALPQQLIPKMVYLASAYTFGDLVVMTFNPLGWNIVFSSTNVFSRATPPLPKRNALSPQENHMVVFTSHWKRKSLFSLFLPLLKKKKICHDISSLCSLFAFFPHFVQDHLRNQYVLYFYTDVHQYTCIIHVLYSQMGSHDEKCKMSHSPAISADNFESRFPFMSVLHIKSHWLKIRTV